EADEAMGGISVLVNNAGISVGGDIESLSFEDWKKVMSVNVDSVFLGTKHALDIRSNSIHPTFIDTPILDPLRQRFGKEEAEAKLGRQVPLGHIGEPD